MRSILIAVMILTTTGCAVSPLSAEYYTGMGNRAATGFNEAWCHYPGNDALKCEQMRLDRIQQAQQNQ